MIEELRELKKLLDEKLITPEEYDSLKRRILYGDVDIILNSSDSNNNSTRFDDNEGHKPLKIQVSIQEAQPIETGPKDTVVNTRLDEQRQIPGECSVTPIVQETSSNVSTSSYDAILSELEQTEVKDSEAIVDEDVTPVSIDQSKTNNVKQQKLNKTVLMAGIIVAITALLLFVVEVTHNNNQDTYETAYSKLKTYLDNQFASYHMSIDTDYFGVIDVTILQNNMEGESIRIKTTICSSSELSPISRNEVICLDLLPEKKCVATVILHDPIKHTLCNSESASPEDFSDKKPVIHTSGSAAQFESVINRDFYDVYPYLIEALNSALLQTGKISGCTASDFGF